MVLLPPQESILDENWHGPLDGPLPTDFQVFKPEVSDPTDEIARLVWLEAEPITPPSDQVTNVGTVPTLNGSPGKEDNGSGLSATTIRYRIQIIKQTMKRRMVTLKCCDPVKDKAKIERLNRADAASKSELRRYQDLLVKIADKKKVVSKGSTAFMRVRVPRAFLTAEMLQAKRDADRRYNQLRAYQRFLKMTGNVGGDN